MTSSLLKKMFARLVVIGVGLAFAIAPAAAAPLVLDWQVIGTGTGGTNGCTALTFPPGTCTFSGSAIGTHIGSGTYSVIVNIDPTAFPNGVGSGGFCFFASGFAQTVTAANGDTIIFNTLGLLCTEGGLGSAVQYNGTYRITGGSGRFSGAGGGGSLTAILAPNLSVSSFIKIDGTINF